MLTVDVPHGAVVERQWIKRIEIKRTTRRRLIIDIDPSLWNERTASDVEQKVGFSGAMRFERPAVAKLPREVREQRAARVVNPAGPAACTSVHHGVHKRSAKVRSVRRK